MTKKKTSEKPELGGQSETLAKEVKTEMYVVEAEAQERPNTENSYKITCCNPINDSFGGVTFKNGVAHTKNVFTASWFGNKEGYTVSKGEA